MRRPSSDDDPESSPDQHEEQVPPGGWDRPEYGMNDRGMEVRSDWRGPGEMPGYRDAPGRDRARAFGQNTASGGQVPSEFREWGRSGDRGERRILGEERPEGDVELDNQPRVQRTGDQQSEQPPRAGERAGDRPQH